ncbi:MAG: NUDIX hydrolase [Pseudomonadota bacterium]
MLEKPYLVVSEHTIHMYDFANRQFKLLHNEQGQAAADTVLSFGPERHPWCGSYRGSNILAGQVLLTHTEQGISMFYQACDADRKLRSGQAQVTINEGDPTTMSLDWQWNDGQTTESSTSKWQEIPGEPITRTRSGAYALITKGQGDQREILLCRISDQLPDSQGRWTLPGGGIEFGEHPEQAMQREVFEETGYTVASGNLAAIDSWVVERGSVSFHALGYIYTATVTGGELTVERNGTTDLAAWHLLRQIDDLPTVGLVKKGLAALT